MDIFRLIRRNLMHDRRRTLLTIGSVSLIVVLLAVLLTVYNTLTAAAADPQAQRVLGLRDAVGGNQGALPVAYVRELEQIEGVGRVLPWSFVHVRIDPTYRMMGIAVAPDGLREMMPPVVAAVPEDRYQAFARDRIGVLMGREVMNRYKWKVGDVVTLIGGSVGSDFPVRIAGVIEFDLLADNFILHHDYFESLSGGDGQANVIFFRIPKPEDVPRVRREVEARLAGSPVDVEVITMLDFVREIAARAGDVSRLVLVMVAVIALSNLLVVANTLAMSARERTRDIAVLRSLGFGTRQVLGLVLGEAGLITLLGCLIGGFAAYRVFHVTGFSWRVGAQSYFSVGELTVLESMLAGLVMGLLAGLPPALASLKVDVIENLRKVV
jgi:putative ABC transport system permease protein